MYKKQMLFQRIICIAILIACAFCFIVSLGVVTDIFDTVFPSFILTFEDVNGFKESMGLDGNTYYCASYYYNFQDFNNQLVMLSIALIVISLTLFITCTNTRRRYYISNYVATGLTTVANIGVSIWAFINVAKYVREYQNIEFDKLKEVAEMAGMKFHQSTASLEVAYLAFGILVLVTALLVLNLIWKIFVMKNEQKALSIVEEVNHD